MRKSRLSFRFLLSLLMVLALSTTAFAAGEGGGGGGGGGKSPLSVVSVQVDGMDLDGATVAPEAVIEITFDRGMTDNFEANAALIKLYAGETEVDAAVAQADKSVYTVTPSEALAEGDYELVIGADVTANNGSTLGDEVRVSFAVAAPAAEEEAVEEEPAAEEEAAEDEVIQPADTPEFEYCVLSDWVLIVNGKQVDAQAYNVDGYNYYKLRDIAMALNGTANQFSVAWDEEKGLVTAVAGEPYEPVGGELEKSDEDLSDTCVPSPHPALFNGTPSTAYTYNIGGYNYFKLRDLADVFGFAVDFDAESRTVLVTTSDYVAPADEEAAVDEEAAEKEPAADEEADAEEEAAADEEAPAEDEVPGEE